MSAKPAKPAAAPVASQDPRPTAPDPHRTESARGSGTAQEAVASGSQRGSHKSSDQPASQGSGASSPRSSGGTDARSGRAASDVVLVHGLTADRKGLRVIRARDEKVEVGEVRPVESGKPLAGEVVRLEPRPDFPLLCDVKTDLSREELAAARARGHGAADDVAPARKGPPQVATQAYRDNWDAIYRSRNAPGSADLN